MKTIGAAVYAGAILMAAAVSAAEQSIPTPAPSGYVDTESSVNVPLPDWPDLGRRVKIDLAAYATPSNAIQIAFGQDTNGDEDLEPEETMLVIGVDCGVPFVREEEGVENRCRCRAEFDNRASLNAGQQGGVSPDCAAVAQGGGYAGCGFPAACSEDDSVDHSSTSTSNLNLSVYTFRIKQPSSRSERVDFAKVTTWGREDTAAQIAAEITRRGIVLLLR